MGLFASIYGKYFKLISRFSKAFLQLANFTRNYSLVLSDHIHMYLLNFI